MLTEQAILDQLTTSVSDKVTALIKENLSSMVQQEISIALAKALSEGQFYRTLNTEVIDGIEHIYSEIKSVKQTLGAGLPQESMDFLSESDSILDEIMQMTEKATLKILEYLETMQDELRSIIQIFKDSGQDDCIHKLNRLDTIILDVMTELSFQDLTGQQIKRVVGSLKKVEDIVFNVYVTSEIMKKSKEQSPDRDAIEIKDQARDMASSVRIKKDFTDQDGVDKLLEQLGM
jgi:chemotaxis protein CheZ